MALGNAHFVPHITQLLGSTCRLASQPSFGSMLQSPQPLSQAPGVQPPLVHAADPSLAGDALPSRPLLYPVQAL